MYTSTDSIFITVVLTFSNWITNIYQLDRVLNHFDFSSNNRKPGSELLLFDRIDKILTNLLLDLQSGTCNLREAVIIGSIIQKVSIPMLHSRYVLFFWA